MREKKKPLFPRHPIFNREDYSIYHAFLCHIHPYYPTKAKETQKTVDFPHGYQFFLFLPVYSRTMHRHELLMFSESYQETANVNSSQRTQFGEIQIKP